MHGFHEALIADAMVAGKSCQRLGFEDTNNRASIVLYSIVHIAIFQVKAPERAAQVICPSG
jgi:hypothetical protein